MVLVTVSTGEGKGLPGPHSEGPFCRAATLIEDVSVRPLVGPRVYAFWPLAVYTAVLSHS